MSQLVDIYNRSTKLRPTQAKQIPAQETDFFDRNHEFQNGFTTLRKKGDPTEFLENALQYYNTELSTMVIPESFVRQESGIPLNEWSPDKGYYQPGQNNS
jgi:hypothetical protein